MIRVELESAPLLTNESPAEQRFEALFAKEDQRAVAILEANAGVHFGSCPVATGSQAHSVHVMNSTDGKVQPLRRCPGFKSHPDPCMPSGGVFAGTI